MEIIVIFHLVYEGRKSVVNRIDERFFFLKMWSDRFNLEIKISLKQLFIATCITDKSN